jgi:hypothetical protein
MNLAILSTGEPTYWPSDKKISDLLDFDIIRDISKDFCRTESCLELSSDYSPVIFTINNKIINKDKSCTFCNTKTKWPYFQELLKTTLDNSILLKTDDDVTRTVESFNNAVQQAAWNTATPISSNPDIHIEYSSAIEEKQAEERKLH